MNDRTIFDLLSIQNSWWEDIKEFPVRKVFPFKRSDFYHIHGVELLKKEGSLIIGQRGVGKSTILFEIIRSLLGLPDDTNNKSIKKIKTEKGVDPKRILFATFEETRLQKVNLFDILKVYTKFVLREDIAKLSEKIYVFLDEIQEVNDWGSQIKTIQNLEYDIKIFLSGSSSVAIKNEASKAARRLSVYSMHPLKFSDFLQFKLNNDKKFTAKLSEIIDFRREFITLFRKNKTKEIYEQFLKYYVDLKPWITEIEILFDEYRVKGGYPSLLNNSDYKSCTSTLRDTFWLGFHKDLMLAKGIGDPAGMRALTEYIASISSWETNYTDLREKSGATKNSDQVKKYLYHLENSFLVNISNRFNSSPTRKGSRFKVYLSDIAIRNMLQGMLSGLLFENESEMGLATETLVYDHMLRLLFKIRPYIPLMYTKDKKKGKEVDIILKLNGKNIPVEVKKSDNPPLADVVGLRIFCKERETMGIVSCGKKLSFEENIVFLPHWLFILIS